MSYPDPPTPLPPPPAGLGHLGTVLHRLATLQGSWPPHPPRAVRTAVLPAGLPVDARRLGEAAADAAADDGVDLLVVGCAGPPAPALVALAALLRLDPVGAVGTSPGPGWADLVAAVRDGLRHAAPGHEGPQAVLDSVGAPSLAFLAGLLTRSAIRRTPMLLDGAPTVVAAAVLADRLARGTADWLIAGCSGAGPAARGGFAELGLVPLLDLRLGVPGGAALARHVLTDGIGLLDG